MVGVDVTALANSAKRAGYEVYAVDYFGDVDLRRVCRESLSIIEQEAGRTCGRLDVDFDPHALLRLARKLSKRHDIDAALLSSGLEDRHDLIVELSDFVPILGNSPELIQRARDKATFFEELERLDVPHPETRAAQTLREAVRAAKELGYPVVVKPEGGSGGVGIRRADHPGEMEAAYRVAHASARRVLVQKYVAGTPASSSLISTPVKAVALTVNEQLLGIRELGQRESFGYCGNIVPISASEDVVNGCKEIVERVVSHFNLVGSNGVDFVLSGEGAPYVVEVNPRFQGSLECVERTLEINVVEAHVAACVHGMLPAAKRRPSSFCARLVLFAPQRSRVPDLAKFGDVRDVPLPGVIVEQGEPVCSIVREGSVRDSALEGALATATLILHSLEPLPS
ncbi:MAG: ATP-grasp domain-containing protein [Candidatus Bathyarchaeia archaeon]